MDNEGQIHPLRTVIISPTLDANPIFNNLKSSSDADKHEKYSDELLQSIVNEIRKDKEETTEYHKYIESNGQINARDLTHHVKLESSHPLTALRN